MLSTAKTGNCSSSEVAVTRSTLLYMIGIYIVITLDILTQISISLSLGIVALWGVF